MFGTGGVWNRCSPGGPDGGPDKGIRGVLDDVFLTHRVSSDVPFFSEFVGTMDSSAPSTCLFSKHPTGRNRPI